MDWSKERISLYNATRYYSRQVCLIEARLEEDMGAEVRDVSKFWFPNSPHSPLDCPNHVSTELMSA